MKPLVSFVVPVRNDAARLETCLRSIVTNGHGSKRIEIIVVDNGSTDGSAAVARRFGAEVVTVEHGRVSALRNQGASRAREMARAGGNSLSLAARRAGPSSRSRPASDLIRGGVAPSER